MPIAEEFADIRKELERIEKEKAERLKDQPIEQEPKPYIFATDYVDCAFYDATLYPDVTISLPGIFIDDLDEAFRFFNAGDL